MPEQKPWEKYAAQAEQPPWLKYAAQQGSPPNPILLQSRQQASKAEFERNLPESTIGSRTREAITGALEPFAAQNIPSTLKSAVQLFRQGMSGNPAQAFEAAKSIVTAPFQPVGSFAAGVGSGDYDKAAYGAGGMLTQTVPAVEGAMQGAKALRPMAQQTAERFYESALKPAPRSNTFDDVQKMVNTGLTEGIPVSRKGVGKLNSIVDELNTQIAGEIAKKPDAPISPNAVASRVNPLIERMKYQDRVADMGAAQSNQAAFLGRHSTPIEFSKYPPPFEPSLSFKPPVETYPLENPIPGMRAQAIKQGIWQELKDKAFGELQHGYKESQKQLGRGLREELQTAYPNIEPLNAREGRLLSLKDELEAAANRNANRDLFGFGTPIVGLGAELATGSPLVTAGAVAAKEMFNPAMKSRVAIALHRLAR